MNETLKTIKNRTTCRSYLPKQITDEELNAVIEAGLYAPSGMNQQSAIFIVIQDEAVIERLGYIRSGGSKGKESYYNAPTLIAVLANPELMFTYEVDGSLCVENMLLAAESLGLGSACLSAAKEVFESPYAKELMKDMGIDQKYVGIEHVLLGYRDGEKEEPKERRENRVYKI